VALSRSAASAGKGVPPSGPSLFGRAARPLDHPSRPRYEALYRDLPEKIRSIQSDDGLWRPGLLDARAYPLPETSGSAFFTCALAWRIHHHLLNRKRFSPVVARAWKGLPAHVCEDGRLGCIQPLAQLSRGR
jgi:unsaturated rhamnogalacturonyl hydrolase